MMNKIFETLKALGVTSAETREIYSHSTRDVNPLTVYRDSVSGVIYIDEFYTGENTYVSGQYRREKSTYTGKPDYERYADAARRVASFKPLYIGRNVADFGCGSGDFLRATKDLVASGVGIELQQDYVDALNADDIKCLTGFDDLADGSLDTMFSFHTLEHLPDPVETLKSIQTKLKNGGHAVFEVPHASDFLLSQVQNENFKDFTLWSQHLILHTRDSLRRLLSHAGYRNITVKGTQRYPLSNHLNWLAHGKPGGHKSILSAIDSPDLHQAYEKALANIDCTDTLTAICQK